MSEGNSKSATAAEDELEEIVEAARQVEKRLRALYGSLPAPPAGDTEGEGEEEIDATTEIRAVIDCVLTDSIGPAIRDLLAAVAYARKKRGSGDR